jgi:hypothetical protein|eukprot:SAG25_NODE_977_length_4447_cov_116.375575_4_plen_53_part_00
MGRGYGCHTMSIVSLNSPPPSSPSICSMSILVCGTMTVATVLAQLYTGAPPN